MVYCGETCALVLTNQDACRASHAPAGWLDEQAAQLVQDC